jgi:hypothetical protein
MAERAGLGNALLHLLTGDEFGSAEALRLNFVQRVVPAGTEFAEALRIAQTIAAQAPLAVIETRRSAVLAVEQGPILAQAEFETVQQRLAQSEDAKEGVASFREKRAAVFKGRCATSASPQPQGPVIVSVTVVQSPSVITCCSASQVPPSSSGPCGPGLSVLACAITACTSASTAGKSPARTLAIASQVPVPPPSSLASKIRYCGFMAAIVRR